MGCLPFKLTNGGPFSLGYNGGSNGSEARGEGTGAANGGGGGGAPRLLSFATLGDRTGRLRAAGVCWWAGGCGYFLINYERISIVTAMPNQSNHSQEIYQKLLAPSN